MILTLKLKVLAKAWLEAGQPYKPNRWLQVRLRTKTVALFRRLEPCGKVKFKFSQSELRVL